GRLEDAVSVETRGAFRVLLVAGPLDSPAAHELRVGEAGVVAGSAARARLPGLERALGIAPLDERLAVLVAEVHAARELEQDLEVRARLSRRVDRLLDEMHRPV